MDVSKVESPHAFLNISELISSPGANFYDFFWSPDGKYISLNLGIPEETNPDNITSYITIIQLETDQPMKVTALSDMESWCVGWSPDSKYLVYEQLFGYTEPYGEIGAKFPITELYLYDIQSGTKVDFVKAPGDREVFNFFINVK